MTKITQEKKLLLGLLNPFLANVPFYTLWKRQKTKVFLIFVEGVKGEHCLEIGKYFKPSLECNHENISIIYLVFFHWQLPYFNQCLAIDDFTYVRSFKYFKRIIIRKWDTLLTGLAR